MDVKDAVDVGEDVEENVGVGVEEAVGLEEIEGAEVEDCELEGACRWS